MAKFLRSRKGQSSSVQMVPKVVVMLLILRCHHKHFAMAIKRQNNNHQLNNVLFLFTECVFCGFGFVTQTWFIVTRWWLVILVFSFVALGGFYCWDREKKNKKYIEFHKLRGFTDYIMKSTWVINMQNKQ